MRPEFLIADLETVRIVADPTRMRILELLVIEPQPVKSLAAALELPQTKLYYHINLLEERGLIRVTGTRVVSGIIEKRYAAAARSYRIDDELLRLASPDGDSSIELMLGTLLDSVKHDLRRGLAAGLFELRDDAPLERKVILGRAPLRLTPERAAELHERIGQLFKEYCPDPADAGEPAPGTRLYHLFVAYFPTYLGDEQPDQE
jgi:DNA-binding transcriptional ArsR family regulator